MLNIPTYLIVTSRINNNVKESEIYKKFQEIRELIDKEE